MKCPVCRSNPTPGGSNYHFPACTENEFGQFDEASRIILRWWNIIRMKWIEVQKRAMEEFVLVQPKEMNFGKENYYRVSIRQCDKTHELVMMWMGGNPIPHLSQGFVFPSLHLNEVEIDKLRVFMEEAIADVEVAIDKEIRRHQAAKDRWMNPFKVAIAEYEILDKKGEME